MIFIAVINPGTLRNAVFSEILWCTACRTRDQCLLVEQASGLGEMAKGLVKKKIHTSTVTTGLPESTEEAYFLAIIIL